MSYNEYGFTSPEESAGAPIQTNDLRKSFETEEKKEYPKSLSSNPMIAKLQGEIYSLCGIDINTENNSGVKRLTKGFLDGSIFSKAELINMVTQLNPEEMKKVALYIFNNISTIFVEIAQSIPNGLKGLLSKNTYDAGLSLADFIPTNKFLSLACAPVGIALKKTAPAVSTLTSSLSIRGLKTIAEREAHLTELMKKPITHAEQIRKDVQSGALGKNHGDLELRIATLAEMNSRELDGYLRQGSAQITSITNPAEKLKAIEEFEPWKKLASKLMYLDNQKYSASAGAYKAVESTVETGIRREL